MLTALTLSSYSHILHLVCIIHMYSFLRVSLSIEGFQLQNGLTLDLPLRLDLNEGGMYRIRTSVEDLPRCFSRLLGGQPARYSLEVYWTGLYGQPPPSMDGRRLLPFG